MLQAELSCLKKKPTSTGMVMTLLCASAIVTENLVVW
jgi:hypothetical protein